MPHDHEIILPPYNDIPVLTPLFQIDCLDPIFPLNMNNSYMFGVRAGWYRETCCYDIVTPSEVGFAISRYLVTLNEDMTGGTIKRTASFEILTIDPDEDVSLEPYRICNDQLVMLLLEGSAIESYTSRLSFPYGAAVREIYQPLVLGEQIEIEGYQISLCPLSARLCLLSNNQDEVYIYDLRSPLCSGIQSFA